MEIIVVYYEKYAKHIHIICWQNPQLVLLQQTLGRISSVLSTVILVAKLHIRRVSAVAMLTTNHSTNQLAS